MAALGRRAAGGPLLAQEATRPDGDSIIIVPFGGITDHFGLVLASRYLENRFGQLTRPFYLLNKAEKKKNTNQTPRATGILGVPWCFSLFFTSLKVHFSDFPFFNSFYPFCLQCCGSSSRGFAPCTAALAWSGVRICLEHRQMRTSRRSLLDVGKGLRPNWGTRFSIIF